MENQIFSGIQAYQELMSDSAAGYQSVVFGVNDPAQFDEIVAGLKQNDAIDWRAFKVETNNKTYKAAAAPLEKYQSLITTVLILIVAVSIVVLSLILTMWAKSRVHETGVLLSVGIRKTAIIGQYLAEVLLIAVFAFGLSFFPSNLIAGQIGNSLLQAQVQSTEEQPAPQDDNGLQINMKDKADGHIQRRRRSILLYGFPAVVIVIDHNNVLICVWFCFISSALPSSFFRLGSPRRLLCA